MPKISADTLWLIPGLVHTAVARFAKNSFGNAPPSPLLSDATRDQVLRRDDPGKNTKNKKGNPRHIKRE